MVGHATYMQKNDDFPIDLAIFTKALPTDRPTDQPTDQPTGQPTDQPTDQRTDIPSYRDAIAASKNVSVLRAQAEGLISNPQAWLPIRKIGY